MTQTSSYTYVVIDISTKNLNQNSRFKDPVKKIYLIILSTNILVNKTFLSNMGIKPNHNIRNMLNAPYHSENKSGLQ